MPNRFHEIFSNHSGKIVDKWDSYLNEWENIFYPFREKRINLFEIGVLNGGSLEIWGKYFRNAENIIGCDNNDSCQNLMFSDPRISVLIGEADSCEVEDQLSAITPFLDIVIDDGSHYAEDIIKAFVRYFKYVNNHGLYIIEDLHTSYWPDSESGLNNPFSAISFLKRLSDLINYEHWQKTASRVEFLSPFKDRYKVRFDEMELLQIHSIKFSNSICIIEKGNPKDNSLGLRRIVGQIETITSDLSKLNGTTIHDTIRNVKESEYLDTFSMIDQVEKLELIISKKIHSIEALDEELSKSKTEISILKTKNKSLLSSINQLIRERSSIEKSIQNMDTLLSKNDAENRILQSQNKDFQNKIKELSTEKQNLAAESLALSQKMKRNHQKYEELQHQLANVENELFSYVLSKSWRWTRPLRKIMSLISGKK